MTQTLKSSEECWQEHVYPKLVAVREEQSLQRVNCLLFSPN